MSLLDLQAMSPEAPQDAWGDHHRHGESSISLLLCDSTDSELLCL